MLHCSAHVEQVMGAITEPVTFGKPTALHGLVDGTAVAQDKLDVHGMVTGDLIVSAGATVAVHGTVTGAVINDGGTVQIFGTVGVIRGAHSCEVMPGAKVSR